MDNQSISFGSFDAVLDERIEAVCTRMFGENIQVLKKSVKDCPFLKMVDSIWYVY